MTTGINTNIKPTYAPATQAMPGLVAQGVWIACLVCLAMSLPLLALIAPVNHDETQYLAASYLRSKGLVPFRDFLFLQTPLQVFAFAQLFDWFPGHSLPTARVATGLIGSATMLGLFLAVSAVAIRFRRNQ